MTIRDTALCTLSSLVWWSRLPLAAALILGGYNWMAEGPAYLTGAVMGFIGCSIVIGFALSQPRLSNEARELFPQTNIMLVLTNMNFFLKTLIYGLGFLVGAILGGHEGFSPKAAGGLIIVPPDNIRYWNAGLCGVLGLFANGMV